MKQNTAVSLADIQSMRQSLVEWDNEMRTKTSLFQGVLDDILHLAVVQDDDQEDNEEATIAVDESPKLRLRHACRSADTTAFLSTADLLEQLPLAPSTRSARSNDRNGRSTEDHETKHRKKRHSRRRHKSKKPSKSHAARSSSPMERYGQHSTEFFEAGNVSLRSFQSAPPFLGESSSSLHSSNHSRRTPSSRLGESFSSLHSSNHSRRATSSRNKRPTRKLKENKDWKDIMKQLDDLKKSQRDFKKEQKKTLKEAQKM